MRYVSTRGESPTVPAHAALRAGVAPDGGLYLPEIAPDLRGLEAGWAHGELGARLLSPFFANTPLEDALPRICADAFDFPVPLVAPDAARPGRQVLELFHGPTGAFKDFGARFLFRCFDSLAKADDPITVLAATSGDTGGAVGCAAEGAAHARAVILFPKDRISAFQERQLCCWEEPVQALRVEADFDACQALVKQAFADRDLSARHGLTSANSINIGRFLPQMTYWAKAALDTHAATGKAPGLIIPTGNLGNAFAAVLARAGGLPIGPIILATNANETLTDWFASGRYSPRNSIATLANAMDVGAPSNFERLASFDEHAIHGVIKVDDNAIRARIRSEFAASGYVACPHTATGLEAYERLSDTDKSSQPWIIGATAHAYKFADVVEPLIGEAITPPPALAAVLRRPTNLTDITPRLADLAAELAAPIRA